MPAVAIKATVDENNRIQIEAAILALKDYDSFVVL